MWKCYIPQSFKPAAHLAICTDCQTRSREHELSVRLMATRASRINWQSHLPSPEFMQKLSTRLQVENVSGWEMALVSLRGWVVTFSTAAALLLILAAALTLRPASQVEEVFTASTTEATTHNAFWIGE